MFSKRRRQLHPGVGFGSDRTHNSLHEWSRVFRASQLASQPTGSGIDSTAVYYLRSPLRWEGRDTEDNLLLVPLPYNSRPPWPLATLRTHYPSSVVPHVFRVTPSLSCAFHQNNAPLSRTSPSPFETCQSLSIQFARHLTTQPSADSLASSTASS